MTQEGIMERNHVTGQDLPHLFEAMYAVLESYSNVHRGSGHKSQATTQLYDKARTIVLDYLGLQQSDYTVIFCTPARAGAFTRDLQPADYVMLSSKDVGLPFGIRAIAIRKRALPDGIPFQTGGGTTRLYSGNWVIWADQPDKFEAGTPAIVNIIAFARALLLLGEKDGGGLKSRLNSKDLVNPVYHNDDLTGYAGKHLLERIRQTSIGYRLLVPVAGGNKPFINMDSSASTSTFEPVWEAYKDAIVKDTAEQRAIIEKVRDICAGIFGAPESDYDIIFTSNTTESVNLLAGSLNYKKSNECEPVILTTILEHSSNDLPWRKVAGNEVIRLKVNKEGFWDLQELDGILTAYNRDHLHGMKRIKLVAASGASNVLGTCNDLEALSRVVHSHGAELMVDGAQLVAHREVNMVKSGIDYLAFSAHKVYAPFGCGVLIARKGSVPEEVKITAGESGEENAGGIAALGKSLQLLQRIGFEAIRDHEQNLTRLAVEGMLKIPGLTVQGIQAVDAPEFSNRIGVIVFSIKNMMPGSIANKLARNQAIGVRYGCHCAHLVVKYLSNFTPRTEKIQKFVVQLVPALKLQGFVRVSFGLENTIEDVEILLQELRNIAAKQNQPAGKSEIKARIREFIRDREKLVYSK